MSLYQKDPYLIGKSSDRNPQWDYATALIRHGARTLIVDMALAAELAARIGLPLERGVDGAWVLVILAGLNLS